ncbi:hypothetical protein MAPG_05097, partial [Magnaporthiopsis poae ATCC 64411]
ITDFDPIQLTRCARGTQRRDVLPFGGPIHQWPRRPHEQEGSRHCSPYCYPHLRWLGTHGRWSRKRVQKCKRDTKSSRPIHPPSALRPSKLAGDAFQPQDLGNVEFFEAEQVRAGFRVSKCMFLHSAMPLQQQHPPSPWQTAPKAQAHTVMMNLLVSPLLRRQSIDACIPEGVDGRATSRATNRQLADARSRVPATQRHPCPRPPP